MRLLYLGDTSSPHLSAWARYFAAAGHDVHVLHVGFDDPVHIPDTTAHPPRWPMRLKVRGAWRLGTAQVYAVARRVEPDLIHSHEILPAGYMVAMTQLRPHVATAWGSEVLLAKPWQARAISSVVKTADLMTADSHHLLGALNAHGAPRDRLLWVPWGIERTWVERGLAVSRSDARTRLGLPADRPLVIAHRGIRDVYCPEVVIRALPVVIREIPEVFAVLLYHPTTAHKFRPALEQLVAALGIAAHVKFMPLVPHDDVAALFRAADVCVSIAASDSAPLSVFEVLAVSRPVIVSDLPWVHEPVHRNAIFPVIPVGDHEGVAAALVRTLTGVDEEARRSNCELVKTYFDRDRIFSDMGEEYDRILAAAD